MKKIEEVSKIIADNNNYVSNGTKCLLFVNGVPTLLRGNGNIVVAQIADKMPSAEDFNWGDSIINKLAFTEQRHSYGRFFIATIIGDSDINYEFGYVRIKFRQ